MSFDDAINDLEEAAKTAARKKRASDGVEACADESERHFKKILSLVPEEDRLPFMQGMAAYLIHISKNIHSLHKEAADDGWDIVKLSTIEQLAVAGEVVAMGRIKKWMMKQGY